MNHIRYLFLFSILALLFLVMCGRPKPYPDEIYIRVILDEWKEVGYVIRAGNKEYRGHGLVEAFCEDMKKRIEKVPELKATINIDHYIKRADLYGTHVFGVFQACLRAGIKKIVFHAPFNEAVSKGEYRLRGPQEDVVLPKADCGESFNHPENKRIVLSIQRPGYYVHNRKNWGIVDNVAEKIRLHLQEISNNANREPDGYSKVDLLIRADSQADFKYVSKVMEMCKEQDIKINRIELGCSLNELELPVEGNSPVHLKEGKVNLYCRKDKVITLSESKVLMNRKEEDLVSIITLKSDAENEKDFSVQVDNWQPESGDRKLESTCNRVLNYRVRLPGIRHMLPEKLQEEELELEVIICPDEKTKVGHVVSVINACYRAEVTKISLVGL